MRSWLARLNKKGRPKKPVALFVTVLLGRRVLDGGRRLNAGLHREQLQSLPEIEFAVLRIRVKRVELLDGLVGSGLPNRQLVRKLADYLVRALPVEKAGRDIQAVELADAHLHRVTVAVDVAGFGWIAQLAPKKPVVLNGRRSKPHSTTHRKPNHHARNEFLHLARPSRRFSPGGPPQRMQYLADNGKGMNSAGKVCPEHH